MALFVQLLVHRPAIDQPLPDQLLAAPRVAAELAMTKPARPVSFRVEWKSCIQR
jgi:hypothetical protein